MVVAGGRPDGRLGKALVDPQLAQSANMQFGAMHDPGLIEVTATLTKDQSLDTVRDIIYKTLEDVVRNPPTAAGNRSGPNADAARAGKQFVEPAIHRHRSVELGNRAGRLAFDVLQHDRLSDVSSSDVVRVAKAI